MERFLYFLGAICVGFQTVDYQKPILKIFEEHLKKRKSWEHFQVASISHNNAIQIKKRKKKEKDSSLLWSFSAIVIFDLFLVNNTYTIKEKQKQETNKNPIYNKLCDSYC